LDERSSEKGCREVTKESFTTAMTSWLINKNDSRNGKNNIFQAEEIAKKLNV
jgi:hypothetical protein